jgi:hypothetical protein
LHWGYKVYSLQGESACIDSYVCHNPGYGTRRVQIEQQCRVFQQIPCGLDTLNTGAARFSVRLRNAAKLAFHRIHCGKRFAH